MGYCFQPSLTVRENKCIAPNKTDLKVDQTSSLSAEIEIWKVMIEINKVQRRIVKKIEGKFDEEWETTCMEWRRQSYDDQKTSFQKP